MENFVCFRYSHCSTAAQTPATHSLLLIGSPSFPWMPISGSGGCICTALLFSWSMTCTCKLGCWGILLWKICTVKHLMCLSARFAVCCVWEVAFPGQFVVTLWYIYRPVPKHLHTPGSNGRYSTIQCRISHSALTSLLRDWSSFVLVEGYSYVKLMCR